MNSVRATVRLQLNAGFTLDDARARLDYFDSLGISHLYLSPVSRARSGSLHGYDVVDHGQVNPELGGERALRDLAHAARLRGMGLVIDIVPNHMATDASNAWWWDVLAQGADSAYAHWFDIDWRSPSRRLRGKVLAPFLAQSYMRSLGEGQIQLVFDSAAGQYCVSASGMYFPLAPGSFDEEGRARHEILKRYEATDPEGRRRLHALLGRQHYLLAWWRSAARFINWRRFFEISDLVGMRVENPEVFDAVHALTLRLYAEGLIDGVRVDHVDGLADPPAYCRNLRAALEERVGLRPPELRGQTPWVVVEKILAPGEALDESWKVDGTTGYDFMDQVCAVLHDEHGRRQLGDNWRRISGDVRTSREHVRDARRQLLRRHFVAERAGLLRAMALVAPEDMLRWGPALSGQLVDGILVSFPVYRSYLDPRALAGGPAREALTRLQQLTPPLAAKSLEDTVFYRYGRLLSRNEVGSDPDIFSITPDAFHAQGIKRAQALQGAMLATATHDHKRGEDARARLAVLSELPKAWGRASHRWLHWPDTGYALSGRLQAGERYMLFQTIVGAWPVDLDLDDDDGLRSFVRRLVLWQTKALREAKVSSSWFTPDYWYEQRAEDFLISLVLEHENHMLIRDIGRFAQYIAPAGALNSLAQLVMRLTFPGVPDLYQGTEWWDFSLVDPDNRTPVDFAARERALAELDGDVMLAAADPGEAGSAIWATRRLLAQWRSGRLKQALLCRLLRFRREAPGLFADGGYQPLAVKGPRHCHVIAYARTWQRSMLIVIVPRLCASALCGADTDSAAAADAGNPQLSVPWNEEQMPVEARLPCVPSSFWTGTRVMLPPDMAGLRLRDRLAGGLHQADQEGGLALACVLDPLSVAVLQPDGDGMAA
jgi:(1->4)-alpha-D-glucan 1-alpha-D-glucosylmutase